MYMIDNCDHSRFPELQEALGRSKKVLKTVFDENHERYAWVDPVRGKYVRIEVQYWTIKLFTNLSDKRASSIAAKIQRAVGGTLRTIDDPVSDEVDSLLQSLKS